MVGVEVSTISYVTVYSYMHKSEKGMYRNYLSMSLLSFNLLNEVGSFCVSKHAYDVIVERFTFAIFNTMRLAEAFLRTKWHLDPSSI